MKSIRLLLFINLLWVGSIAAADKPPIVEEKKIRFADDWPKAEKGAEAKESGDLLETTKVLVKNYGAVCPDFPCETESITHWRIRGRRLTGDRFERLILLMEQFPLLQRLDLEDNPVTDDDVALLVKSKIELVEINLDKTRVTDKALPLIAERYSNLNSLGLNCTAITDYGLKSLEALDIHYLHIGGTKVTNEGMKSVANFVNLRDLNIALTKVDGKGLATMMAVEVDSETFRKLLTDHRSDIEAWLEKMKGQQSYQRSLSDTTYDAQEKNCSIGEFSIDMQELQIYNLDKSDWVIKGRGVQNLERLWWVRSGVTFRDLICMQAVSDKRVLFHARPDF
jgi:hypothetical protein